MGKRTERELLSMQEQGGIVTVKYVELTYTDADAWLKACDADDDPVLRRVDNVALREFPESPEFPGHTQRWAILDLLFRDGPLYDIQIRKALGHIKLGDFNKAMDELLADSIIYRDVSGVHIDAQWLENYIADFLAMPGEDEE